MIDLNREGFRKDLEEAIQKTALDHVSAETVAHGVRLLLEDTGGEPGVAAAVAVLLVEQRIKDLIDKIRSAPQGNCTEDLQARTEIYGEVAAEFVALAAASLIGSSLVSLTKVGNLKLLYDGAPEA